MNTVNTLAGLGPAIASLRAVQGMTQMDLKRATGLAYPYVRDVERGAAVPSLKSVAQICGALRVTLDELVRVAAGEPAQRRFAVSAFTDRGPVKVTQFHTLDAALQHAKTYAEDWIVNVEGLMQ